MFELFGLRLHGNPCLLWVRRRSRIYIAKMYVRLFYSYFSNVFDTKKKNTA